MIPMRILVALASLLPLAQAECSKPCMSRCARALLDPVRGASQAQSCLAFLQQGEDATVPVELQDVCRSNKAYSRACSCIGVSATVSPSSTATAHTPSMSTSTSQSDISASSTPPGSSNTPISSSTPISSIASATSDTPASSATPESSTTPDSSTTVSTTTPDSSTTPVLSTTPESSTAVSSTTTSAAPVQSEFFDMTVYVSGDPTPHNANFRSIGNGYGISWNVSPTVPGKLGIEPGTGRLYALIAGSTDKLWGSTSLPLKGSLVLSFWTPAMIAAYGGSIVYVKCGRDADGYVTCGYEDQDLARLKPTDNKNIVLGKHPNAGSTTISTIEYPVPVGYPTVNLLVI